MDTRAAHQIANLYAAPRYGVVAAYNPALYRVKVSLAPAADGANPLTGYMPLASPWVGNGWGWVAPPMPKQQHPVAFMQQNPDQPIALPGFFDTNNRPPMRADGHAAQGGELLIVHASGSRIEIRNDQKVLINGQVEIDLTSMTINITATDTVNVTAATTVNVTAPSVNLGTSQGGLQTLMTKAAHDILATHTHPGTGPMTQTLPSNSLTTAVQAD